MSDMSAMDLPAFFARYDRNVRRLMLAAICATLLLSAVNAGQLLTAGTSAKPIGAMWGMGVFYSPFLSIGWWIFTEFMARRRNAAPDAGIPANADDARNGMRIANAGFAFTAVLMTVGITQQIFMGLTIFGYHISPPGGWAFSRIVMLLVGGVTIYLGNLWPRMPVSRAPEQKAAARMKANRISGWFMVIVGLGIILLGLFLPYIAPPGIPAPPPFEASRHREISLPQTELDRFVGRYDFGHGFTVSVTHDGLTLRVFRERSSGAQPAPIYPEAPHAFFWRAVEAQIRFSVDGSGTVTGAQFRQGDAAWQPGRRITP
jgi:hypothetical protein